MPPTTSPSTITVAGSMSATSRCSRVATRSSNVVGEMGRHRLQPAALLADAQHLDRQRRQDAGRREAVGDRAAGPHLA